MLTHSCRRVISDACYARNSLYLLPFNSCKAVNAEGARIGRDEFLCVINLPYAANNKTNA